MRRLLSRYVLACLAGGVLLGGPAFADTAIGGWSVTVKPDGNGVCTATRAYTDKDDENKKNSVVFGLIKDKTSAQLVVVLGYEDWAFDKDEAVIADLIVDGKTIYKKLKWEGDGKVLTSVFNEPDTLLPVFGAGKELVLHFGKGENADFQIPNAGLALGAVQLCIGQTGGEVQAQAPAAASVPAPAAKAPEPSQAVPATSIGRTALGSGDKPSPDVVFPADTAKISVFIELLSPKLDDKIEAKWIAANTAGAAPGYVIDTSVMTVTAGVQEVDSRLSKPNAGWPKGDYQVDVSVNGSLAKSVKFAIK